MIVAEPSNSKNVSRWLWIIHLLLCLSFVFLIWFYRLTAPPKPVRTVVIKIVGAGLFLITLSLILHGRTFFKSFVLRVDKWTSVIVPKIIKALKRFPLTSTEYWSQITTKKQMFVALMVSGIVLSLPLALIQFFLYPVFGHDLISNWLLYWLYLFFGVIFPGTLVLVRFSSWQMDWLAWVGLGWAVGHGLELISLLVARSLNMSGLFFVWIPIAYVLFFLGQKDWLSKVKPLSHSIQIGLVLVVLFGITGWQFYGNNEYKLNSRTFFIVDAWFHSENAVEFRDHAVMQDPRLAGEPFNYHTFGYAAADAASLLTGDLLVHLILRYVGLNCVWLVTILMFNIGRIIFENRIAVAALGTFIFVVPIDYMSFFSVSLDSGGGIIGGGLYDSISTVEGYVFLLGLVLPLLWFYLAPRWRDSWIIALMAFGGSGSKVMVGPLLLCIGLGMVAWGFVARWRGKSASQQNSYTLPTSLIALGLILVPVIGVSVALILGPGSYSEAIKWVYNDFADHVPIYQTLLTIAPAAGIVIRTLWIFTFSPVILLGAVLSTFWGRKNKIFSTYAVLAWVIFGASLVPTMLIGIAGFSQLFFIEYSLCFLSILAGYGLVELFKSIVYLPAVRIVVIGGLLLCFMFAQIAWPLSLTPGIGKWSWSVWPPKSNFDFQTPSDLRGLAGKYFVLTDEVRDALSWARHHLSINDVFVANAVGPSLYGVYTEHRAFNETTLYTPANWTDKALVTARYGWRGQLVQDWIDGKPDVLARMKQAGITYIFIDRLNGVTVPDLPGLAPPSFENRDFVIYAIP